MSTHKHIDKICCVVLVLTLILTVVFVNAEQFGVQKASTVMGYEKLLFNTSEVHTIDIIMDDWEEFTANCKSEEYYACTVVIDNEAYKNVAIRGKGNTSLTQVNNGRYSYKIEFDHYDSTKTYHGLDKLCLNNIIQDNTYMKDYLSYQMMNEMGVASPLCSYVYITVNGEDWGLYLAVEGIEEAFLQRNFGKNYGELYKPDSTSMGGGRGNGEKFDAEGIAGGFDAKNAENAQGDGNDGDFRQIPSESASVGGGSDSQSSEGADKTLPPDKNTQNGQSDENGQAVSGFEGMTPPDGFKSQNETKMPENMQGGMSESINGDMQNGSDDVLLKYIDDDPESYSNIFDNAKTDVSEADEMRLINSLKNLSSGEDLENTVDVEKVIRYFAVHNFVLNFDSYTGSMIHNYYLYEKDGQLQMIPWDYNLAFGGFQSTGSATTLVNYPIDSPVFGGTVENRPMLAWIFENEEYTELYHRYLAEFIADYFDSGYFAEMIDNINTMISPYVEKDPTKFCTYEEFKTGIATLKEFCLLRAESISGQLNGTIGSTSDTQQNDTLVDAGELTISDMGSMGNAGGGMKNSSDAQNSKDNAAFDETKQFKDAEKNGKTENSSQNASGSFEGIESASDSMPNFDENTQNAQKPGGTENGFDGENANKGEPPELPDEENGRQNGFDDSRVQPPDASDRQSDG